jgi:hypothetical protein
MAYPVTLKVEFPKKLSRLTTFFRLFMLIPQIIVLYFINIAGGVILFISWWAILFIGRYPKDFFDFIVWVFRWGTRLTGYAYLLTDKYPPFSGREERGYPVVLRIETPKKLSRLTTFFRFFMFIPHVIVLYFISIAGGVILFISWWAILFTSRYPRTLFDFIVWVFRWRTRVAAYFYLVTDKYPPFTGDE